MEILWIHGLGESGACFAPMVAHPALAGRRHRAPHLPGYGGTSPGVPPPGFAAIADQLAASLDGPAMVIGHSMGGVIGLHLAERHPDRVSALISVEGNVSPGDCTYSGRAVRDGFAPLVAVVDEAARSDLAHRGYAARIRQVDPATLLAHAAELVAFSAAEDAALRLARLPVPVLYVAGVAGGGGACSRSRQLLDEARVRTVELSPSGHWPFVDQPDRFAALIAETVS